MRPYSLMFPVLLLLAGIFTWPPVQAAPANQSVPVIKLGKVTVHGQKVIRVLQAIKIALREPVSSDPKLANAVVCRIHNAMGSRVRQILTCGTNAALLTRTSEFQTAAIVAVSSEMGTVKGACISAACYTQVFGPINSVLAAQRNGILTQAINGPAFRAMLEKLPMPVPARIAVYVAASPATLVTGQGQNEVLQLGGIKVSGQPMIQKVLQTVKFGLQKPYSNDPALADVVVCRLNAESGNPSDQVLTCATNRTWSSSQSLRSIMAGAATATGGTSCSADHCQPAVLAQFASALDQLPGHYLQTSVNLKQLHRLMDAVSN